MLMIALLLGGIGLSATGVYLAFRRVRNDLAVLFRMAGGVFRRVAAPSGSSLARRSTLEAPDVP
jgi:hypothetical protein